MSTNEDEDYNRLLLLALDKVNAGEELLSSTEKYKGLEGLAKIQRKIKQELNFLRKIIKTKTVKKEHIQCSNLTHFSALIKTLETAEKVVHVNKVFVMEGRKITVDIVCDDGLTWIKVIARNPKSLSQICMGNAGYGVRSVIDQAEEFLDCAKSYPCLFRTPKIIFEFSNGIGSNVAAKMESFGILVRGERLDDLDVNQDLGDSSDNDEDVIKRKSFNSNDLSTQNISHIKKLNLDVSAMLAYVSSVTNGSAGLYTFPVQVLAQQAEWERLRPQKPLLEEFFKGKTLYCCQTAYDSFLDIVNTVGGPNERLRAEEFLKRITVLPDDSTTEDTDDGVAMNVQFAKDKYLSIGGKIRGRSLVIFTFGDRIGAVTVTANDGFVRSAKQQGINFVVFVHESRALTEQKEQTKAVLMDPQ